LTYRPWLVRSTSGPPRTQARLSSVPKMSSGARPGLRPTGLAVLESVAPQDLSAVDLARSSGRASSSDSTECVTSPDLRRGPRGHRNDEARAEVIWERWLSPIAALLESNASRAKRPLADIRIDEDGNDTADGMALGSSSR